MSASFPSAVISKFRHSSTLKGTTCKCGFPLAPLQMKSVSNAKSYEQLNYSLAFWSPVAETCYLHASWSQRAVYGS